MSNTKILEKVKKQIQADVYNNVFSSDQIIKDSNFVDFIFIGEYEGDPCIWNACISTTKSDYYEIIRNKAIELTEEVFPLPDNFKFFNTKPLNDGSGCYSMTVNDTGYHGADDKYKVNCELELMKKGSVKIRENKITIDTDYKYGVGLNVRLNLQSINVADIYTFIAKFLKTKDKNTLYRKAKFISFSAKELGISKSKEGNRLIFT